MRRTLSNRFPLLWLFSAGLGQYFLSLKGNAWTLVPAFLFWGLALWGLREILGGKAGGGKALSPKQEALAFACILLAAIFFRVFRIDVFPCGVSLDQAVPGLGGLAVLEGWRPVFETPLLPFPSLVFYPAALWFHFFTPTQEHLALFCAAISVACFPLVYWTFRQLAGPLPALFTVGFLALSWWDAYLARWAAVNLLPGFFIFGALAFWLHGLSSGKTWLYLLAGLFTGLGLYGYFAFRIFPILMAGLALWEIRNNPRLFRRDRKGWLGFLLVFAVLALPLLWHWSHEPSFGQGYPGRESIGGEILARQSPMPLVKNALDLLAMFSREGDPSPKETSASSPMLDGVTGALALLGLALAFSNLKTRSSVYPLILFAGLSLNNVLCLTPANVVHVLPLLPCVVFWAGSALARLSPLGKVKWRPRVAGAVFLATAALNYHQLFDIQAKDPANPRVFDLGPTLAGRKIAEEGSQYDFVLCPSFELHGTVRFLGALHSEDLREMDWPKDAVLPGLSPGKQGVCFLLEEGEEGTFRWIQSLFPECKAEVLRDPQGVPLVYSLCVPREEILAARGLKESRAGKERSDPGFPLDLPPGALQSDFSGNLFIPQSGPSRFWIEAKGNSLLKIDGHPVLPRRALYLERGFHALEIQLKVLDASKTRFWAQGPDGTVSQVDPGRLTRLPVNRGLLARYFNGETGKASVVFSQWDPVVNFTHRTELALFAPPLGVRWEGLLRVSAPGLYRFLALTEPSDRAQLWVDEKALTPAGALPSGQVSLSRGWHRLRLDFQMGGDFESAISLAWEKPGESRYEVIPAECFGMIGKGMY